MIVSNSTPLINFAAIGRLDIMEALFTKLTCPRLLSMNYLNAALSIPV